MKFDPTKQLSNKEASDLIGEIVENGEIIISNHAKERMDDRGYTVQDVHFILTDGKIMSSEFDHKTSNWKYKFYGDDLNGDSGSVIAAIVNCRRSVIITVLG